MLDQVPNKVPYEVPRKPKAPLKVKDRPTKAPLVTENKPQLLPHQPPKVTFKMQEKPKKVTFKIQGDETKEGVLKPKLDALEGALMTKN